MPPIIRRSILPIIVTLASVISILTLLVLVRERQELREEAATGEQTVKLNDNSSRIDYAGGWTYSEGGGGTSVAFQNDYHFSPTFANPKRAGATATFTFVGNKVSVGYLTWVNRGIADIEIDGQKVGDFNGYAGQIVSRKWTSPDLACQSHTLKATVSGRTTAPAGGIAVVLDFVEYQSCTPSSPTPTASSNPSVEPSTTPAPTPTLTPGPTPTPQPSSTPTPGICPSSSQAICYDCNKDRVVNVLDFSCFINNYNRTY